MLAGMTRAQLKGQARARLSGQYGNMAGTLFLIYLISLVFTMVLVFGFAFFGAFSYGAGMSEAAAPVLAAFVVLAVGIVILYFMAVQILMAGYARMVYRGVTEGESSLNDLTYALNRRMLRFLGLSLLMVLVSFLAAIIPMAVVLLPGLLIASANSGVSVFWLLYGGFLLAYLLFIIPFLCWYWTAFMALTENPDCTLKEAMTFARILVRGRIWRMIKFQLSFLGMYALGYISFGLGYLWVMPYSLASNILFYQQLKEEQGTF